MLTLKKIIKMYKNLKMKGVNVTLNLNITSRTFRELFNNCMHNAYNKQVMNEELHWKGYESILFTVGNLQVYTVVIEVHSNYPVLSYCN